MKTNTANRTTPAAGFGPLLREWRHARGTSQLDLSLTCGVSQRHLSFLESGRSRPSRDTVLHLAAALNVPLHQQNAMLLSAGFAPVYAERAFDAPDMRPIDRAIEHLLKQQEPYPALVVDEAHNIVRANARLGLLLGFLTGVAPDALPGQGPVNAIEIVLRPDGLRSVVENWAEVAAWSVRRLRAEAMADGPGSAAARLLDAVLRLPDVAAIDRTLHLERHLPPTLVIRFVRGETRLSLFSIIATVGTPLDVSLQNLRLELFFPADEQTAQWFSATG
ncbi:MAG: helix-turn-helix transcriptional regulator [Burkholderiales bacterium]|nr:helix-turn-helix transcriptional regulator [Burkholderiales bacterium]